MKKVYLVKTNGTKEFWTVEMLEDGGQAELIERTPNNVDDEPVVAILRSLYSEESVDAQDTSVVEDDSSWDAVALTAEELEHLFDGVDIIDGREA